MPFSNQKSIISPTGDYGLDWPANLVLTQGSGGNMSSAGWTVENEGFVQQTFLGASVRNFDLNAGFGDTTSSLSVSLVEDEYNKSDETGLGSGDDIYHNGIKDQFSPPLPGTPVFFKFGKNTADIEQSWRKTFDDTYGDNTLNLPIVFPTVTTNGPIDSVPDHYHFLKSKTGTGTSQVNTWENRSILYDNTLNDYRRGYAHFVFGGILQTYTQNRGPGGNPVYNLSVQDPREILSNATMILNNYAGTTYNNKNLFNLYGFLEYDVSDSLQSTIETGAESKSVLKKVVASDGSVSYGGIIEASTIPTEVGAVSSYRPDTYKFQDYGTFSLTNYPPFFPVTGQGYARRSDQGMPIYRIFQAMETLFEHYGNLPDEYVEKGFGGAINFRGFNYIVDWSGIPTDKIPPMYFMDFDQIDMLSFAQELCDIISHDMFVTLLPVIDHPACSWLHNRNQHYINTGQSDKVIAGIIRIDTIDKSQQPEYGAIKSYLDSLESRDIYVENRDVGYELSNVVTDKFIVGAQEVEMHYFHSNKDRDNLQLRRHNNGHSNTYELLQRDQWSLQTSLKQQILPFYGFLGKEAVTIPRGWGSYQQILLDTTGLDAFGVGNYYVTTEMELRSAIAGYKQWVKFLLQYNERYVSEVGENQALNGALVRTLDTSEVIPFGFDNIASAQAQFAANEYAVDVPRCVFNSDRNYVNSDGYPASACSPPYGYPLYFKRAERIGIPQAGFTELVVARTQIQTNFEKAKNLEDKYIEKNTQNEVLIARLEQRKAGVSSHEAKKLDGMIEEIREKIKANEASIDASKHVKAKAQQSKDAAKHLSPSIDRLGEATKKNSMKIFNFLKEVASKHLGKKFLVKIPKMCNLGYNKQIAEYPDGTFNIKQGPFGFRPDPVSSEFNYYGSVQFQNEMNARASTLNAGDTYEHYLDNSLLNVSLPMSPKYTYGALKGNFNPISEKWEFNYKPEPQGGFFNYAIFDRNLSFEESRNVTSDSHLPLATQSLLTPKDLTNFVGDNGRISCYVRYNNSQFLNLSSVPKDSLAQEKQTSAGLIPDISEEVNNLDANNKVNFDAISKRLSQSSPPDPAVAFVKCELSEKFYMPPKIRNVNTKVFGRDTQLVTHDPIFTEGEKEDDNGCKVPFLSASEINLTFVPNQSNGGADGTSVVNQDFVRYYNPILDGEIIRTDLENLDDDNVYAIITVPGKIEATQDQRYLDGIVQSMNAPNLKNALTVDVVKGVAGFDKPSSKSSQVDLLAVACKDGRFSANEINEAMRYYRDNKKNMVMGQVDVSIGFASPSPVHPDVVALPLMSMERCYGPWQSSNVPNFDGSSRIRYSDIGGKVEFSKDESLAPWNYAGYQLMNEAGSLKAQFSNSMLLFMERGGFVMPEAPTGISLAKALQNGGPLVTSISVNIGDSVKTTVKMDLYTSRFGKLQKQKEDAIGRAARERQKRIDERNSLIRKGMGKSATSADIFGGLERKFAGMISSAENVGEAIKELPNKMNITAVPNKGGDENSKEVEQVGTMMDQDTEEFIKQGIDWLQQKWSEMNTAGGDLTDVNIGVSFTQDHPNFPSPDFGNFDPNYYIG